MSFRSRSSDHVPVVPTMISTNPGVKRIHVYRNGDAYFQGVQVVINTHRITDINILLDVITERIGLTNGAKKLFTTSGTLVKDVSKIKDNDKYVASSSHFTPMAYGGVVEKKVRSKTRSVERHQKVHPEEEKKKKKKKKKKMRKKEKSPDPRPPSSIVSGTVEVETPSEVEDSEHEEQEPELEQKEPEQKEPEPEKTRRKSIWCW